MEPCRAVRPMRPIFSCKFAGKLHQRVSHGHRDTDGNDSHCSGVVFDYGFHLLHGDHRLPEHDDREFIHGDLYAPHIHQLLSDARRLRIDELPGDDGRAIETAGGQSRQLYRVSQRLHLRLSFYRAGGMWPVGPRSDPRQNHSYSGYIPNPNPGGYCQGFIISRLGTARFFYQAGTDSTNGSNVNWTNTPVTSCSTAGTTSCIQLRADAVGYAVTSLLSTASTTETNDGVTNQFQVGLFHFYPKPLYCQRE